MPIYEYSCNTCGNVFSKLQSIRTGPGETECTKCKSLDLRKIPSSFASAVAGAPGSEFAAPATQPSGGGGCCGGGCGCG
ncbi:MAG: zinc ribbon domain-containing protein [Nitrospiraceae bacterium]|nr:zinc ribbon domain-containing protein [Nitrospiraceae bacterium]